MTEAALPPFHLAVPVSDLAAARDFYGGMLGCQEGRSSESWVDFNLFGHQFVVHLGAPIAGIEANAVDSDAVPSFHFGVVLDMATWQALADRLEAAAAEFIIRPKVRFKGEAGEQATMFIRDPAGNALEFKAFADINQLFARD